MQLNFEQVRAMDVHSSTTEEKKGTPGKKSSHRKISFICTEKDHVDMHSFSSRDDCCALQSERESIVPCEHLPLII